MTEEEKKQIRIINNFVLYCRGFEEKKYTDSELFLAIENVSDLIQNQQSEIERKEHEYRDLELKYNQNLKFLKHFREELQKQDKMIDLMANNIASSDSDLCQYIDETIRCKYYAGENKKLCDDCIKQYFEKQVESEDKQC